jgi:hypothetical protein
VVVELGAVLDSSPPISFPCSVLEGMKGKAAAAALEVLVVKLAAECLAIAIPNIPLSILLAIGTFRTGFGSICPFTILCTAPAFFSKTKISFGPKNAYYYCYFVQIMISINLLSKIIRTFQTPLQK